MPRQRSTLTQEVSDRELFETAAHVLPNLRAVTATQECFGPNWKAKTARHNVHMYEYDAFASGGLVDRPRAMSSASALRFWPWARLPAVRPHGSAVLFDYSPPTSGSALDASSGWPSAHAGIPYAGVVFCELNCHWTEALDMLFSSDAVQFGASASAIWGKKLQRCEQLRSESFQHDSRVAAAASPAFSDRIHRRRRDSSSRFDAAQPGRIGVNSYELAPKHDLRLSGRPSRRAQQLCFATYTQKAAARNEATVVMRTLPKDVHDRLVEISDHSALRGAIDHVAVGYHLAGRYSDTTGHYTRLVMCAYASTFSGNEVPEVMSWRVGLRDAGDRANSDAKHVVTLLARAACDFESVVQRRRLGLQPFLHATRGILAEASCAVCEKDFGLLRRNQLCQLCGHHVCRRCSRKYQVETRAGGVRKRRVCFSCAGRVESSTFVPLESPAGNKSTASTWNETVEDGEDDCADRYQPKRHTAALGRPLALPADVLESPKPGHQLAEALFSPHPLDRARALEFLRKAVEQVTQESSHDANKPLDPVLIDKYLEVRRRLTRMTSSEFLHEDVDSGRAFPIFYQQPLGSSRSRSVGVVSSSSSSSSSSSGRHFFTAPQAPAYAPRLDDSDGEKDGLDAICEVAARRLNCPMAFVAVVGRDEQHIVGAYQVPGCMYRLPRNQSVRSCGLLADGKAMVATNPTQDPRLCHLPIVRDAGVRFFASFPVRDRGDAVVASICTIDTLAHDDLTSDDHAAMATLAKLAADVFNAKS